MSTRRLVSFGLLIGLAALLGTMLSRLPTGVGVVWDGWHPVFILTHTWPDADSIVAHRTEVLARANERPDTYLASILAIQDSFLARWPERSTDPVRVHVTKYGAPGFSYEMEQAVRRAFSRWSSVPGVPVRFEFLARPTQADVLVYWADTLVRDGSEMLQNLGGYADREIDDEGWFTGGTIWIALRHRQSQRGWSPDHIYETALHEIGHLLGLHHSDDPADIMWHTSGGRDLTARDMQTARLLYQLPPGDLRLRFY